MSLFEGGLTFVEEVCYGFWADTARYHWAEDQVEKSSKHADRKGNEDEN